MKHIFEKARKELNTEQFNRWICFAYGVLESNITDAQAEILLKGIEQDKKYNRG